MQREEANCAACSRSIKKQEKTSTFTLFSQQWRYENTFGCFLNAIFLQEQLFQKIAFPLSYICLLIRRNRASKKTGLSLKNATGIAETASKTLRTLHRYQPCTRVYTSKTDRGPCRVRAVRLLALYLGQHVVLIEYHPSITYQRRMP